MTVEVKFGHYSRCWAGTLRVAHPAGAVSGSNVRAKANISGSAPCSSLSSRALPVFFTCSASVVRQTDRRLFIVGFPCDPLCPLWLKPLTSSSDTKTYAGSRRNITITIFDALHQVDRQALPNASIFQLHREPRTGLRLASRQMSFLLKSKVDPFSTDRRFVSL